MCAIQHQHSAPTHFQGRLKIISATILISLLNRREKLLFWELTTCSMYSSNKMVLTWQRQHKSILWPNQSTQINNTDKQYSNTDSFCWLPCTAPFPLTFLSRKIRTQEEHTKHAPAFSYSFPWTFIKQQQQQRKMSKKTKINTKTTN